MITQYHDIHTHNLNAGPDAIINLPAMAQVPATGAYSVGLHPWDSDTAGPEQLEWLRQAAAHPNVVAIGETGLDALRGAPLDVQEALLREHIALSESLGKPVIIHAVRTLNRIIELRQRLRPQQRWIVHGFRGKRQQAQQLLRAGLDISLGEHFNAEVPQIVPVERLFTETDMSPVPIAEIRSRILGKGGS